LSDFHARILVVDDDKAVRAALRVNLEKAASTCDSRPRRRKGSRCSTIIRWTSCSPT
jgi:DNA-binding response OmpR family regulator